MAARVDQDAILAAYDGALAAVPEAAAFGRSIAHDIDRIVFVGCGGPNRTMLSAEYWVEHLSLSLETRRYFPAELLALAPRRLDARTLVVLGSKSGTTPETLAAAAYLKDLPCRTVGITQTADRPLAQAVQTPLLMGKSDGGHAAMFMVLQAMLGGILAARDGWDLLDPLLSSLRALPQVMADTAAANDARATEEARIYKDDRILYHVAAGPMFSTAYVFGVCVLMEMQWMHSVALEAAEFFHGPFEIVDANTPLLLMKGEDPSRPLMERVERFCRKYTERLMIYDTADFPMTGIDARIRPMVGPYVMQAAVRQIASHLAVWHAHPLSTRRYMWKTEY
ncbi:MAG: SIS domain-containing protein [Rhodospirillales bacterium]|nr:SIS domain-containing protein [Rhodospirillales bacterium]